MAERAGISDIALVRWPEERERLEAYRREGAPRLVLVNQQEQPPDPTGDPGEDWVRLPVDATDLHLRVTALRLRTTDAEDDRPVVDDDGVVGFRGRSQVLPPIETRLMAGLLDRYGAVVSRDKLMSAGWPDSQPDRNSLDTHIVRLRRRLAALGLGIRTVRSRGYMLIVLDTSVSGSVQERVS